MIRLRPDQYVKVVGHEAESEDCDLVTMLCEREQPQKILVVGSFVEQPAPVVPTIDHVEDESGRCVTSMSWRKQALLRDREASLVPRDVPLQGTGLVIGGQSL